MRRRRCSSSAVRRRWKRVRVTHVLHLLDEALNGLWGRWDKKHFFKTLEAYFFRNYTSVTNAFVVSLKREKLFINNNGRLGYDDKKGALITPASSWTDYCTLASLRLLSERQSKYRSRKVFWIATQSPAKRWSEGALIENTGVAGAPLSGTPKPVPKDCFQSALLRSSFSGTLVFERRSKKSFLEREFEQQKREMVCSFHCGKFIGTGSGVHRAPLMLRSA